MTSRSKRPQPRKRTRKSRRVKSNRKYSSINRLLLVLLIIISTLYLIERPDVLQKTWNILKTAAHSVGKPKPDIRASNVLVNRVITNYGLEIDKLAMDFNLCPKYLKALIVLESSGHKPAGKRFERHIYLRLKRVQNRQLLRLENLTYRDLHDATDQALRNMATSWGPFQIMGYKCIWLNIQLSELRGGNALYWGVKWIDLTYGEYVRQGKYKDAFHIHNTGQPHPTLGPPQTYDKNYINKGIYYMTLF